MAGELHFPPECHRGQAAIDKHLKDGSLDTGKFAELLQEEKESNGDKLKSLIAEGIKEAMQGAPEQSAPQVNDEDLQARIDAAVKAHAI
ncbi:MAG: hypothetical protein ACE5LB_16890, partial [Acidiferrobacterales bacterium]